MHIRLLLSVSLLALVGGGCLELGEEPTESTATAELGNFPDLSPYRIEVTSANGGGCIDFPLGSPAPYWLQQYFCHGGTGQQVQFESMSSGANFRIRSVHDNQKCLDVPWGSNYSGAPVQFYPCHNGPAQRWVVNVYNAQYAKISPANAPDLCLDVANASTGRAPINLITCTAAPPMNRLWKFRTWRDTRSFPSCTGNVTINGVTIIPGALERFQVPQGNITGTCASVTNPTVPVNCPFATNWLIVNRSAGTGQYWITCFQQ